MSALLWVVGCAEHGINFSLLEKTLKSLRTFNHFACSFGIKNPSPIPSSDQDVYDASVGAAHVSDDFFQGIAMVGVLPNTILGKVGEDESHKYITMVTSGYKVRFAHEIACPKLPSVMTLDIVTIPYGTLEYISYEKLKKIVQKPVWEMESGWPHDAEMQQLALITLKETAQTSMCAAECPMCCYAPPRTSKEMRRFALPHEKEKQKKQQKARTEKKATAKATANDVGCESSESSVAPVPPLDPQNEETY